MKAIWMTAKLGGTHLIPASYSDRRFNHNLFTGQADVLTMCGKYISSQRRHIAYTAESTCKDCKLIAQMLELAE